MQTHESFFPLDIYLEHLANIKSFHFTRREIDVIACLLSMRGMSRIATLLSITPRTVETHTRNIMLKLECNSREGIIDFIEKSGKLSLFRKHYSGLLVQEEFEKTLKEIARFKRRESSYSIILYGQNQDQKNILVHRFESDLKRAGINKEIRLLNEKSHFEKVKEPHQVALLLSAKSDHQKENFADHVIIKCESKQNYYFLFFEILKKLFPSDNFENIIASFKEKYEVLEKEGIYNFTTSSLEEKKSGKKTYNFKYKIKHIFRNRKRSLVSALLVVGFFGIITLPLQRTKEELENYLQRYKLDKKSSIRSDLIMPAESSLLHRPELISQIDAKLKEQHGIQAIALVGIGGAGKTTLARQYAHQQRENIIWEINAETRGSLKGSFENLAQALARTEKDKKILREIQEIKDPKVREGNIIHFVKEGLKNNSSWFLIFDNVEKFADIQKYFPFDSATWGLGKVILTTRDENIQNNEHVGNTILIGELDPKEKLNLFTKIMSHGNKHIFLSPQVEEIKKFLESIPSFPLDVSVAAYYLKVTNTPYVAYLENLNQYNKNFREVQQNLLQEAGDYTKTRYGIITLSLQQLIDTDKDFRDLLLLICLLDSQNIPRDLLEAFKSDDVIDYFIYHLKKYSFISGSSMMNDKGISSFSLHRSAQAISLAYLIKSMNLEKHKRTLTLIANTLENHINGSIEKEDFSKMKNLISHLKIFLSYTKILSNDIRNSINIKLGYIYYYLGDYMKARKLLDEGFENLNLNYGNNYTKIADISIYLGDVYRELGDCEKSKNLLEQSLIIYNKEPSKNYVGIGRGLAYLGNTYRVLGNHKKARNLLEQSLLVYKKYLPENHVEIARSLGYLGIVHTLLDNCEEAINLFDESLAIYKGILPENHMGIAWTLGYLGNNYRTLGNYKKAKDLLEQSLMIYKSIFPEDSVRVAWALAHLGNVYRALGDYQKSKNSLEKSLLIYKKLLPENSVKIAWAQTLLGNVYRELKNLEKAKNLFKQSLMTYEKHYGKNHFETAKVLRDLGQVYLLEGNNKTTKSFLEKSFRIFQENNHPEGYTALEVLTELYQQQSKEAMNEGNRQISQNFKLLATNALKQALEIIKIHFPKNSPHLTRIQSKLNKLSQVY